MQKAVSDIVLDESIFLEIARFFSSDNGVSLLHSGGDFDSSQNSFLFLFPKKAFSIVSSKKPYKKQFSFEKVIFSDNKNPWDILKSEIGSFSSDEESIPFSSGFLTYEFGKDFSQKEVKDIPLAFFLFYSVVLKYDRQKRILNIFFIDGDTDHLSAYQKKMVKNFSEQSFWENFLKNSSSSKKKEVSDESIKSNLKEDRCSSKKSLLYSFCSKADYIYKIKKIQELIEEGKVYEVNLSHELVIDKPKWIDPFSTFLEINRTNPAPFSAYLKLRDYSIVSSSPERFLLKDKNYLETRPIKGTINRGMTEKEDLENIAYLRSSEKEKAELRMISDLLRNDLYLTCEKNSIEAKELFRIEKYSNVFHMLSIIVGKSKKNIHPVDILKHCFPGGSITGCPKLASQNVIAAFEQRERGIYTGCIGYFAKNGDFDFNIAIRTMFFQKKMIYLPVGGAILLDSDPEKEYFETYYKAKSMLEALRLHVTI